MSKAAVLRGAELPLATPVILAGIRVSTTINIGTATIGSTVGAKGLGEVIIAGLQAGAFHLRMSEMRVPVRPWGDAPSGMLVQKPERNVDQPEQEGKS